MKKILSTMAALAMAALSALLLSSCEGDDPEFVDPTRPIENCIKPDFLQAGDKVALISPSYYTPMENVEKTAEVLRTWGLVPVIGPNVGKIVDGKYAGTVTERVSDIRWALSDPTIKAILCNRGGYGSIQLINRITLGEIKASPKWIIGFSDISTLHGLWTRAGVMSIHGTMSSFLANGGTDVTSILMRDLLFGNVPRYELPAHPQNIEGKGSGILVGGNICTFVPNLGTQADATKGDNLILFIEEVEESMHNIDRQLRILQMNGVLDRCNGIILGEFTDCGTEFKDADGQTISVEAMLRELFEPYRIPVLCGFPGGHGDVNLPLVMGAPVTIHVQESGASIEFDIPGNSITVNTANVTAPRTPAPARLRMAGKIE